MFGLIVSSLHYLLTCALFARGDRYKNVCFATEAAKRPYKKISSCAVDTGVKGVKKVRSAIKLCSYKSYNVSCDIYVTGIL